MLVLSRNPGEMIWIGEDVRLSVQRVRGNRVQIGIEAPGHLRIERDERIRGKTLDEVLCPMGPRTSAGSH